MALRFCDSFDHYQTSDITRKWSNAGGTSPTIGVVGRNGTNGMRLVNSRGSSVSKTLDNQATWIVGFGIKVAAFPAADEPILQIKDGSDTQVTFSLASDGKIKVYRGEGWSGGANSSLLGTSSTGISAGSYYFVEFRALISDTVGTADVRINATSVLSLTGLDTKVSANAYANVIQIGEDSGASALTVDIDDLYVLDGTGALNSNFLGDVRVEALFPNGAGNYSQWTPIAGSNYQNVDETPPDDDVTYNLESTNAQKDSYAFQNSSLASGSVKGVMTHILARKDDAGSRSIRRFARVSGTDYAGSTVLTSSSYTYYSEVLESNPATSAPWTLTELNAAEFGIEMVS
jgi:hypothetical protein